MICGSLATLTSASGWKPPRTQMLSLGILRKPRIRCTKHELQDDWKRGWKVWRGLQRCVRPWIWRSALVSALNQIARRFSDQKNILVPGPDPAQALHWPDAALPSLMDSYGAYLKRPRLHAELTVTSGSSEFDPSHHSSSNWEKAWHKCKLSHVGQSPCPRPLWRRNYLRTHLGRSNCDASLHSK